MDLDPEDYVGAMLGTPWGLLHVSEHIAIVNNRHNFKVVCHSCGWFTNRDAWNVLHHRYDDERPTSWCGPAARGLEPGQASPGSSHPRFVMPIPTTKEAHV